MYKILKHANILMATDGSNELFVDTGCGVVALDEAMKKAGRAGYIENNSFTFDGNTNGKLVLLDTFVRVSTKPFDLGQVESVTFRYPNNSVLEIPIVPTFLFQGEPFSAITDSANPLIFTCTEEHFNEQYGANIPVGVYVVNSAEGFISEVHCKDVVHPIDPKYLGGVTLPVVELTTTFEGGAFFTAEENAKLKAAYECGTPVIIKCGFSLGNTKIPTTAGVWTLIDIDETNLRMFVYFYGAMQLQIASINKGETWMCNTQGFN